MNPLLWFGLAPDTDERELKREYARRLKLTRPDDDPEGFQHLRARYEAALAMLRGQVASARVAVESPVAERDPAPPAEMQSKPETITPPIDEAIFDGDAFGEALAQHFASGDDVALVDWLHEHPALWSIDRKESIGLQVFTYVAEAQPPMTVKTFDALLRFFDLHRVGRLRDPLWVAQLRSRLSLAWYLADPAKMETWLRGNGLRLNSGATWMHRQLTRPLKPAQAWLRGLVPGAPSNLMEVLATMRHGIQSEQLPRQIDAGQVQFWEQATNTARLSKPRLSINVARAMAFGVAFLGLLLLTGFRPEWRHVALTLGFPLGLYATWLFATVVLRPIYDWQSAPEGASVRWPLFRFACVPLLAIATQAVLFSGNFQVMLYAAGVGVFAASLAIWRNDVRRRQPDRNRMLGITAGVALFCFLSPWIALGYWGIDAWRHRHALRLRAA